MHAEHSISGDGLNRSSKRVISDQQYHRSNNCNGNTVDIKPVYTRQTEETRQPPADNRSYNSENDVHESAFAGAVHNLTADKTRDQSEYDPC
jgi:hypothetical protein